MRPIRWVGDVDQSEFEHACQSALSLNYPYDNDLCRQYEYDSCNKWAKPWNCDITAIFFKPCKHKINSVVRQITTLLKIFRMNLFILADNNNIYSQRHLAVIFYYFFLQNDRYFQC